MLVMPGPYSKPSSSFPYCLKPILSPYPACGALRDLTTTLLHLLLDAPVCFSSATSPFSENTTAFPMSGLLYVISLLGPSIWKVLPLDLHMTSSFASLSLLLNSVHFLQRKAGLFVFAY